MGVPVLFSFLGAMRTKTCFGVIGTSIVPPVERLSLVCGVWCVMCHAHVRHRVHVRIELKV
jgi:hypothetical protein